MIDLGPQPALRSERLWLTPFGSGDVEAVFEYAKNPRVARHTSWNPHQSLADAESFITMVQAYEGEFCWAIRLTPDGPVRGAIEFGLRDPANGSVHYVLAEDLWNRGRLFRARWLAHSKS